MTGGRALLHFVEFVVSLALFALNVILSLCKQMRNDKRYMEHFLHLNSLFDSPGATRRSPREPSGRGASRRPSNNPAMRRARGGYAATQRCIAATAPHTTRRGWAAERAAYNAHGGRGHTCAET